jgi:predicted HAD superfamily Cof-like phosphohydrolase
LEVILTNEQQQVKEWMQKFGQETPEKPTIPSLKDRKLRAKLILEEALETITALGIYLYNKNNLESIHDYLEEIVYTENETGPNLTLIADGCEDLKVVTEGTLVACGLVDSRINETGFDGSHGGGFYPQMSTKDPLFNEVMRSNNSKFWTEEEWRSLIREEQDKYHSTLICPNPKGSRCVLVKDKDGKVIKSPSYSPANLQPIIDEMSK